MSLCLGSVYGYFKTKRKWRENKGGRKREMVERKHREKKREETAARPSVPHCDFTVPAEGVGVCRDESGGGVG